MEGPIPLQRQASLIPQGGTMEIGTEARPFLHRVAWQYSGGILLVG